MLTRPIIGSKHRSTLSGQTVKVVDVQGDILVILNDDGRKYVHIRDFNAEYRLLAQQKHVNDTARDHV